MYPILPGRCAARGPAPGRPARPAAMQAAEHAEFAAAPALFLCCRVQRQPRTLAIPVPASGALDFMAAPGGPRPPAAAWPSFDDVASLPSMSFCPQAWPGAFVAGGAIEPRGPFDGTCPDPAGAGCHPERGAGQPHARRGLDRVAAHRWPGWQPRQPTGPPPTGRLPRFVRGVFKVVTAAGRRAFSHTSPRSRVGLGPSARWVPGPEKKPGHRWWPGFRKAP